MPGAQPFETDLVAKKARYKAALDAFVHRLKADRHVLAVVLVGSLDAAVIWRRESIGLWIIEADGVTRRHLSDGKNERIFRTLTEGGVDLHAELIPRSRFKQMIEGTSRTAFTHSFFAHRQLLHTADPSIERWFVDANTLATQDQRRAKLVTATWAIHSARHARKLLQLKDDPQLAWQQALESAWALAALEIVRHGEICEDALIDRARELRPELFQVIYGDLLQGAPSPETLGKALDRVDGELEDHWEELFEPLLRLLKKEGDAVPLSRLGDHFAHTQLYPWHLESACEWLARRGKIDKFSAPYRLTAKSRVEVEEPAYVYDP